MSTKILIKKAERRQRKARICIAGPSGSGKTMSALRIANGLKTTGRILLLDTERASSTLYSDMVDFDQADLPDYEYETFLSAIDEATGQGYEVLIIDSVSHAWEAFLETHGKMSGNSFTNWSKITPNYNRLIQKIITYPGHIICCMRAKTEYVVVENEKGKSTPQRMGVGVIMRPGSEYEFDLVGMIDLQHNMTIEKTRIPFLTDKIINRPGEKFGEELRTWLMSAKPDEVHLYDGTDIGLEKQDVFIQWAVEHGGTRVPGERIIFSFPFPQDKLTKFKVQEKANDKQEQPSI